MNKFIHMHLLKFLLFVVLFFNLNMNWFSAGINKDWIAISDKEQLNVIIQESATIPVIIYKHSTRCSLSSMTKNTLDKGWGQLKPHAKLYFLDLLRHREVSTLIAERFNVRHQSPQILIIKNGQSVFDTSHYDIDVETILENL
jgi:bacillithiol system protein YtxJ